MHSYSKREVRGVFLFLGFLVAIDLIVQHIRDLFNSKHGPHLSDLPRPQSAAGSVNSIESLVSRPH